MKVNLDIYVSLAQGNHDARLRQTTLPLLTPPHLRRRNTMPQPFCLQLPTELWIAVLSHVDDLTLWTSCRRVSRTFRAEAEREFAAQRLKDLRIVWFASVKRLYLGLPACFRLTAFTTGLQSIEDSRATFGLDLNRNIISTTNATPNPDLDPRWEVPGLHGLIHRILSNSDRNVAARLGSQSESGLAQVCTLGPYSLDVPLDNISFDADGFVFSFDWKSLLNNLLGVYAHSQYQARLEKCTDLDADVIEKHLLQKYEDRTSTSGTERREWERSYGSAPARNCFQDAYAQRVTRFHKRNRLFFEPNLDRTDYHLDEEAWRKLEVYVDRVIDMRNGGLWDDFMKRRGIVVENPFTR